MADAILKTEGNISDERLDILAGIAERSCFTASGTTEVAKALRELQALRLSATASEKLLRQIEPDLEAAVLGKPVMLGPALGEVRAFLFKGEAKKPEPVVEERKSVRQIMDEYDNDNWGPE